MRCRIFIVTVQGRNFIPHTLYFLTSPKGASGRNHNVKDISILDSAKQTWKKAQTGEASSKGLIKDISFEVSVRISGSWKVSAYVWNLCRDQVREEGYSLPPITKKEHVNLLHNSTLP